MSLHWSLLLQKSRHRWSSTEGAAASVGDATATASNSIVVVVVVVSGKLIAIEVAAVVVAVAMVVGAGEIPVAVSASVSDNDTVSASMVGVIVKGNCIIPWPSVTLMGTESDMLKTSERRTSGDSCTSA